MSRLANLPEMIFGKNGAGTTNNSAATPTSAVATAQKYHHSSPLIRSPEGTAVAGPRIAPPTALVDKHHHQEEDDYYLPTIKRARRSTLNLPPESDVEPPTTASSRWNYNWDPLQSLQTALQKPSTASSLNGLESCLSAVSNEAVARLRRRKRGLKASDYRSILRRAKLQPCKWIDYFDYVRAAQDDEADLKQFGGAENEPAKKTPAAQAKPPATPATPAAQEEKPWWLRNLDKPCQVGFDTENVFASNAADDDDTAKPSRTASTDSAETVQPQVEVKLFELPKIVPNEQPKLFQLPEPDDPKDSKPTDLSDPKPKDLSDPKPKDVSDTKPKNPEPTTKPSDSKDPSEPKHAEASTKSAEAGGTSEQEKNNEAAEEKPWWLRNLDKPCQVGFDTDNIFAEGADSDDEDDGNKPSQPATPFFDASNSQKGEGEGGQKAPLFSTTGLFGNNNGTEGGLFGSSGQPGGLFNSTQSSFGNDSKPLFGSFETKPAASSTNSLLSDPNTKSGSAAQPFGTNDQTSSTTNLFSADMKTGASNSLFGTDAGGNLFGNTSDASKPAAGGSLFGNTSDKPAAGGGLFGNTSDKPAAGGGLFGNTSDKPAAGGGLFGSTSDASKPAATGGLFGSDPAKPAAGGLFGNTSDASKPATTGSLFGNTGDASKPAAAGSLFGNSNDASKPAATGSLFGNTSDPSKPGAASSLFGNVSDLSKPTAAGSLFGSSSEQPGNNLFGNPTEVRPGSSNNILFGNPSDAGNLFTNSDAKPLSPFGGNASGLGNSESIGGGVLFGNNPAAKPNNPFGSETKPTTLFGTDNNNSSTEQVSSILFGSNNPPQSLFGNKPLFENKEAGSLVTPQATMNATVFGSQSQTGSIFGDANTGSLFDQKPLFGDTSSSQPFFGSQNENRGGMSFNPSSSNVSSAPSSVFPPSNNMFGGTPGTPNNNAFGSQTMGSEPPSQQTPNPFAANSNSTLGIPTQTRTVIKLKRRKQT